MTAGSFYQAPQRKYFLPLDFPFHAPYNRLTNKRVAGKRFHVERNAEGASLENRRNQMKLSGKRTPSRISLESLIRDADGANPLYKG